MSDDNSCTGFVAQQWNRDRCKRCFRLRNVHSSPSTSSAVPNNKNSQQQPTTPPKPPSWKPKVAGAAGTNGSGTTSSSIIAARSSKFGGSIISSPASPSAIRKQQQQSPLLPITITNKLATAAAPKSSATSPKPTPSNTTAKKVEENEAAAAEPETSATFKIKKPSSSSSSSSSFSPGGNSVALPERSQVVQLKEEKATGVVKEQKKKVVLVAEVSVDDGEAEGMTLETDISSSAELCYSAASHSRRSESPAGEEMSVSYRSAQSGGVSSVSEGTASNQMYRTASFESLASTTMDTKSMVTAMSGDGSDDDENGGASRGSTPTDNLLLFDDTHHEMQNIQTQLELMEAKCATLENENAQLRGSQQSLNSVGTGHSIPIAATTGTTAAMYEKQIRDLTDKLSTAESLSQDYKKENTVLKSEIRNLQDTLSKNTTKDSKKLTEKLTAAESLCEEMMEENERLKREVGELQNEIEELQDQYREEEIEEFRDLQRELEQTAKNCRILQFKLRKTERVKEQTEADRVHLESKVKEIAEGRADVNLDFTDSRKVRELESELRIAKEVSVRLHNELEASEEKRCKLEDNNFLYKEKIREMETREKLMEASKQKYSEKKAAKSNSSSPRSHRNSGDFSSDYNIPQLLRDLQDATEKEQDMREQLKFAEEDLSAHRKKLSDLETENDGLSRQLSKLTSAHPSGRHHGSGGGKRPPMIRSMSEGQNQIQLELAEHEVTALKTKLEKSEREATRMGSRIAMLEKEIIKVGGNTNFSEDELRTAVPDTYYKQKIKLLEEEIEELKTANLSPKTEADQDPSWIPVSSNHSAASNSLSNRRQRFSRKSRSLENADEISGAAGGEMETSSMDLKRQMALSEQEIAVLRSKATKLEEENSRLRKEHKKLSESDSNNGGNGKAAIQMQKDIDRFIARIADLERQKEAQATEINELKNGNQADHTGDSAKNYSNNSNNNGLNPGDFNPNGATRIQLQDKLTELLQENASLTQSTKATKSRVGELQTELSEYKKVLTQSDNQKLVSMATKVEVLTTHLRESGDKFNSIHRRLGSTDPDNNKYCDALKEEIEKLENELVEERMKGKLRRGSVSSDDSSNNNNNEQYVTLIKTVESQAERIFKQIEHLETAQQQQQQQQTASAKSSNGGTSASPQAPSIVKRYQPDNSTGGRPSASSARESDVLMKDLTRIKDEMNSLKNKLKNKILPSAAVAGKTTAESTAKDSKSKPATEDSNRDQLEMLGTQIKTFEKENRSLVEEIAKEKSEKDKAVDDLNKATQRLLQTEDRWKKEQEKLKENYETQIKAMTSTLAETEQSRNEKASIVDQNETTLKQNQRKIEDLEHQVEALENNFAAKNKESNDKMDIERKRAKEFETKYLKLEQLYESNRVKASDEKDKLKQETSDLKKKCEEISSKLNALKTSMDKKESTWDKEKADLQKQIQSMENSMKETERSATEKATKMATTETKKIMSQLESAEQKLTLASQEAVKAKETLERKLEQKQADEEYRIKKEAEMKEETEVLKSRIEEQRHQLEETRRARDDSREELGRWQQTWARERSEMAHKLRQEEKVQQAENAAITLKYENRIKIMEESSRNFQSQLTQSRRERDQHRDNLAGCEKKMIEAKRQFDETENRLKAKLSKLEQKIEMVDDLTAKVDKLQAENVTLLQTSETDKRLWAVEKEGFEQKIAKLEEELNPVSKSFYPGTARAQLTDRSASPMVNRKNDGSGDSQQETRLKEAMDIANKLRAQIDESKQKYESEIKDLKRDLAKSKQDSSKEKTDIERRLREAQESVQVLEIDRRNFLCNKDDGEQEKKDLESERDLLMQQIHDSEIHQLANKYKLDKVADQLSDLMSKVRYSNGLEGGERKDLNELSRKAMEQLMLVRQDLSKTRELGKATASSDSNLLERMSIHSSNSTSRIAMMREDSQSVLSHDILLDSESQSYEVEKSVSSTSAAQQHQQQAHSRPKLIDTSRSISTEENWETRISEFRRLRTPSPAPRKITNYPDPPPNLILNTSRQVEYNGDGSRTWGSSVKRSTSLDHGTNYISDNDQGGSFLLPYERSMQTSTSDLSTISVSSTIDHHSPRRTAKQIFGSTFLRNKRESSQESIKSTVSTATTVKEKRRLFGGRVSRSVETSGTGHQIGAIGISVLSPAANVSTLPSNMTPLSSRDSAGHTTKKSGSRTSLLDRLRGSSRHLASTTLSSTASSSRNRSMDDDSGVSSPTRSHQPHPGSSSVVGIPASSSTRNKSVSVSDVRSKIAMWGQKRR